VVSDAPLRLSGGVVLLEKELQMRTFQWIEENPEGLDEGRMSKT
jgi:hypothetical protein